jgi:dTDP-4-amino-4,6-dideoxygalactose transaminase
VARTRVEAAHPAPQAFLSFARPSLGDAEIGEVVACLESGWLATGPRVELFERALRAYHAGRAALALSSATAGLHLSLLALELEPGDEVITTPLTFAATANAIVLAGGKPVFAEIDAGTRNLSVASVAEQITSRTRALLPVHFAGLPVDLAPLYQLAERHGLRVIEDAAHAVGAEHAGRRIGSFGDTQVFSFHPNKNMTTGEGGAVLTRDGALAERVRVLRFHGVDPSQRGRSPYDIVAPGFKYNMMDLQAAIGLHQLPRLDGFIARRSALAALYLELLADEVAWTLPRTPSYEHRHAWHLFTICLRGGPKAMERAQLIEEMKKRQIGIGVHYAALHLHRYYRERFGHAAGELPVAEAVGDSIVSLPLFPDLEERDVERVVAALREVLC